MGLDSLLATMETRNVTPVTPIEAAGVTLEPAWIKACTPVTSVTPQNNVTANEPTNDWIFSNDEADKSSGLEAFEERAAIMEFDGGLPRAEAERAARLIVYTSDAAIH